MIIAVVTYLGIQSSELIISKSSLLRVEITGGEEVALVLVKKGQVINTGKCL